MFNPLPWDSPCTFIVLFKINPPPPYIPSFTSNSFELTVNVPPLNIRLPLIVPPFTEELPVTDTPLLYVTA